MSARLDAHVARLKGRGWRWAIPWPAVEALARSEDCRLAAYLDVKGVPTIGWGETEGGVTLDMVWTEDQVDARFLQEVTRYTRQVLRLLTVEPNAEQLGALVRFAYNIGLDGLARSTVLRQHNAGNFAAAARAFGLWNNITVNGKLQPHPGLTARRAAEAAAYLKAPEGAPVERTAQAVAPESGLAASPIAQGGAATVATGVAVGASSVADQLEGLSGTLASVKAFAAQLGDFIGLPPAAIAAAVLIAAGVVVLKWRKAQRDGGWA